MTIKILEKAIKAKKPAVIGKKGEPHYVILDWETYRKWEEMRDDLEDSIRFNEALADPKNQRRTKFSF